MASEGCDVAHEEGGDGGDGGACEGGDGGGGGGGVGGAQSVVCNDVLLSDLYPGLHHAH